MAQAAQANSPMAAALRVRRSTATPRQVMHLVMRLVERLERGMPSLLATQTNATMRETTIADTPIEHAAVITLFAPNILRQEAENIGAYDQSTRLIISRRVEAALDRLLRTANYDVLGYEYYPDGTLARIALATAI